MEVNRLMYFFSMLVFVKLKNFINKLCNLKDREIVEVGYYNIVWYKSILINNLDNKELCKLYF